MDFTGVKEILEAVNTSNVSYFEYETCDGHIIMDKSLTRNIGSSNENKNTVSKETSGGEFIQEATVAAAKTEDKVQTNSEKPAVKLDDEDLYIVKSPMVGTFYKAPGEDKEPFVNVSDEVKNGDVLCIIEAMKLMNEIESEVNGTIIEVLAKDGEMVEYGQPLFKVKEN
ncbi:MAG: acetyl-CoA carboxylase biotin carboxyl carrier protein [Clostridiales bacterium]|nr:acetyl-CoA carboxylase biotin carboxyl carrier protein [Clostridiales bacterium]MDY2729577.1 acetyl-CoA carboxylase biotin carboxyl carrier protein [Clostridium sp.]NLK24149.1 acetyl-CoA carboxylase biotin carboxyl carrier protein [Clostridiales bacterium]